MRKSSAVSILLASVAVACAVQAQETPAESFAIRDVRLFDGERVSERRTVVVHDGRVSQVGDQSLDTMGLDVVEGNGRTLLPGLFDSHVHLPGVDPEAALSQSITLGVTTVIDMFSAGETLESIKHLQELDAPEHASILMAGTGATAPGGHPSQMSPAEFATIKNPAEAAGFVQNRVAEGSDFLKIIYSDLQEQALPMIDRATLEALVDAAHERDLLAVAHIGTEQQAWDAIEAGVDGLAHLFNAPEAAYGFGDLAARHDIFIIPTISVLHLNCGESDGPAMMEDTRLRSFIAPRWRQLAAATVPGSRSCRSIEPTMKQLLREGVPILTGTDAALPGTAYGASVHVEMASMVHYGASALEALRAATSAPAKAFGMSDRGRVKTGSRADLVLVEGDPTLEITDSRNIVAVWKQGIPVSRERIE